MRAMVLAAGLGTRMRPLTNRIPKALVPVAGRPLIEYGLRFLKSQGIEEIIINLHHLGGRLRDTLGTGRVYGVRLTYSPEDRLLDTGGGLKHAQAFLEGDTFVVLNGDTILDLDLGEVLAIHRRARAVATLAVRPNPDEKRYGVVEIDSTGRVCRLRGQPAQPEPVQPLYPMMYTGLQILDPRVFDFMPEIRPFSTTRELYPRMLGAGVPLQAFLHSGPWSVVDDRESLALATRAIVSGEIKLSYLRP